MCMEGLQVMDTEEQWRIYDENQAALIARLAELNARNAERQRAAMPRRPWWRRVLDWVRGVGR